MVRSSVVASILITFFCAALCIAQDPPAEPQPLPGVKSINLNLEAASPDEAFAELARQADVQIRPMFQDLWANADPVELKIENGRFWPVFLDMCQQANVGFNPMPFAGEPKTIRLFRADQVMTPITKYPNAQAQGCIVALMSATRSQTINFARPAQPAGSFVIQATLLADPGLDLDGNLQLIVTEAVDENGTSFVQPGNLQPGFGGQARSLVRNLTANLVYPANAGKKLVRLNTELRAGVVTRSDVMTIDSPMDAQPQKKDLAAMSVEIKSIKTAGAFIEVQAVLSPKQPSQGIDRRSIWYLISTMDLLDAQGNRYQPMGSTADALTFTARFGSPTPGQPPGKPAKLIWTLPVETQQISLPFQFKDLPLP